MDVAWYSIHLWILRLYVLQKDEPTKPLEKDRKSIVDEGILYVNITLIYVNIMIYWYVICDILYWYTMIPYGLVCVLCAAMSSVSLVIRREDQRRVKLYKTTSSVTSRTHLMLCARSTCREDSSFKWVWCHGLTIAKSWSRSSNAVPYVQHQDKTTAVLNGLKWLEPLSKSSARAAERLQYEHLHCNFQQSLHSRDNPFHQRRQPRFFDAEEKYV